MREPFAENPTSKFTILSKSDFEKATQSEFSKQHSNQLDSDYSQQLYRVINFEVASALDRCKVSTRNAVYLIASIANVLDRDVSTLKINIETIRQERLRIKREFSEDIKRSFNPNIK